MPFGHEVHYKVQTRISKTLPITDEKFVEAFEFAKKHIEAFRIYHGGDISKASFYEFGAGRDLAIPLSLYAQGVQKQTLVDINKLLRVELVNATLEKLQRLGNRLGIGKIPIKLLPTDGNQWIGLLEELYGIKYAAPFDARDTGLEPGSFDFITSTNTLEHIPPNDILLILKECHRLLKSDGRLSFVIDYQDHYSYFDPRIGIYNFLQYSSSRWKIFNPPLHYQNRLRHLDYCEISQKCDFDLEKQELPELSSATFRNLESLRLHSSFAEQYLPEQLAIPRSHMLLRKHDLRKSSLHAVCPL